MWIYLERGAIFQIIEVLRAAGKVKIACILEERMAEESLDSRVDERYRQAARVAHHVDGELEFDPSAVVSKGSDAGAYVMGWQWVADEEVGVASDCELQIVDN